MIRFLKKNKLNPELSRLVRARNPYRLTRISGAHPKLLQLSHLDIDDVSILISTIESDGKGVPILLRRYLKLSAQLVGFNVDPKFSSVVDGLLIVDLDKTEPRILSRYMGEEDYRRFSQAGSDNQDSEVVIQSR